MLSIDEYYAKKGKKKLQVFLDQQVLKAGKQLAIRMDVPYQKLVENLIEQALEAENRQK